MTSSIRVVVADDQDLVRSGLEMVLTTRCLDVVGLAADGRQAVEEVRRTRPDVVLMDIRMPVLDGISATREIVAAGLPTRVLVLTTCDLDSYVYQAEATVKTHVNRLIAKLGNRSRVQLVVLAYETGLVRPGERGTVGG